MWSPGVMIALESDESLPATLWFCEDVGRRKGGWRGDFSTPSGLRDAPIGMSELVSTPGLLPKFFVDKLSGPIKSCNVLGGSDPGGGGWAWRLGCAENLQYQNR